MNQTLASLKEREVREAPLEADVVLVGAGPVGLMMANLLGLAGVQVLLLERSDGLLGLPRAIFYDSETLRLFTQVGLFDEIAPGLVRNPHVRHLNARGKALMQMDFPVRNIYGHSACGTFYQPDFERVLLQGTSRFGNVRVLFNHSVAGFNQNETHVTLKVATPDGEARIRAKYAIGCDGGTSAVRDMIGAKLLGSTFSERWLVVDAIVKDHDVTQITFNCDPRRPRVELPAVGDRVRWEFMQLPGETEETLKRDDTIRSLITEHRKDRQFQIERKAVYTFHARVADRWRLGRVFLAGDAAHLMPPFAGQGMNGGMKDAVNLSWKLAAVINGQADESVLATYEAERSAVIRKMVALSRRLGTLIMPTNKPAAFARDMIFSCLNLSGRFRAFIAKGGVLPPPKIRRSALTGTGRDSLIGQMMPQPIVTGLQGNAPLDAFLTCHQWLVLGVGTDPVPLLSQRDLAIADALGARFICLNCSAQDARTQGLQCVDSVFLDWVGQYNVRAVLIRPDRFVADRLIPNRDLSVLSPFVPILAPARMRAAA